MVGTLAVVASSYFFDRLVRDRWGEEARWATLWFAAGVVTLLADGQLTFALGVAFGLASLRCLQMGATPLALAAAAACALASPVAAVFLAGVVLAGAWSGGGASTGRRSASPASPSASPLVPNLAFPERRPVPLRLLLLRRDPALVRRRPLRHPRPRRARSGSCAASWSATCWPRP